MEMICINKITEEMTNEANILSIRRTLVEIVKKEFGYSYGTQIAVNKSKRNLANGIINVRATSTLHADSLNLTYSMSTGRLELINFSEYLGSNVFTEFNSIQDAVRILL